MVTTINNENDLLALIHENSTYAEFNSVLEANNSPKGKLNMLKGAFTTAIKGLSDFLTKPSRAKLLEKSIEESHGDITNIKQINNVTLKALTILEKSKNTETKIDVQQAKNFYSALKARKDKFKRVEHKMKNGDSTFEKFMGYLLWLHYVLSVKMFVNYISLILAQEVNGYKIGDIHLSPFDLRNLVKVELDGYKSGNTDKAINCIIEDKKDVKEEFGMILALIGGAGILALLAFALNLRFIVFLYYYTRMSLADYFNEQADFLKLHETELKKNKNLSKQELDSIITAQKAWAGRFSRLAELVIVDEIDAGRKADKQIKESNKTVTVNNINQKNTGMDFF